MTNVLGYPLDAAIRLLKAEGYDVRTDEVHCRKGVQGDDLRVLRQISQDARTVCLTYAGFLTQPQQ